jgi:hypothetical protein
MRRLWIAVGVNLAMGIPGIVPIFLAYYYLSNGPLADLGWTGREPTENDGTLALSMFLGPILLAAAVGWILANWLLWRWTEAPAVLQWTVCLVASFVPFFSLSLF